MVKIEDLFEVKYGVNLELNALAQSEDGINFVSRTTKNNGVSARVKLIRGVKPIPSGTISVAASGSVMESFLQPEPYYSGRDLYYLKEKQFLSDAQKLYYCACLRANKYRYSYGRQANRTLKDILVPSPDKLPKWIYSTNIHKFDGKDFPISNKKTPKIIFSNWKSFLLSELFDIKKGKRLTKANMKKGSTPFIGSIDNNNGVSTYVGQIASHSGNTITVNYNGSVGEAFYQPVPFLASDDVNVLYPKFELSPASAMFIITIIRQEKYRFNYGRKWHLERMEQSEIRLPITKDNLPDWEFMETYINTLPFSSQLS